MNIGVSVPTLVGAPLDVAMVAQKVEGLGFESIWLPEHTIIPVNTLSPYPGSADGSFPRASPTCLTLSWRWRAFRQ